VLLRRRRRRDIRIGGSEKPLRLEGLTLGLESLTLGLEGLTLCTVRHEGGTDQEGHGDPEAGKAFAVRPALVDGMWSLLIAGGLLLMVDSMPTVGRRNTVPHGLFPSGTPVRSAVGLGREGARPRRTRLRPKEPAGSRRFRRTCGSPTSAL